MLEKEIQVGAEGFIVSKKPNSEPQYGQKVIVPTRTLDLVTKAEGLENLVGTPIELIPEKRGEPIIPIYDLFVPIQAIKDQSYEERNN